MSDLKAAIRKALAGSSSQKPVVAEQLVISALKKCSSATTGDMVHALEELLASREINTASSTKGATTTVLYWLTGSIGLTPAFYIRPPDFSLPTQVPQAVAKPPAAIVQPKTSIPTQQPKEKVMWKRTENTPMSPITQALLDLVGEQPGIGREQLVEMALKRAPGASKGQANKSIGNLTSISKKLRSEGGYGKKEYFLSDGKAVKAAPVEEKKAKIVKQPVGACSLAKPLAAKAAPTKAAKAAKPVESHADAAGSEDFSIVLSENNCLIVSVGYGEFFTLSHTQAERLYRFIGRVHPLWTLSA